VGSIAGMYFFAQMRIPDNAPAERVKTAHASLGRRLRAYVKTFDDPEFLRYELTTFALRFGANLPSALYTIYWIRHLDASDLWISWQATAGKLALIAGYFMWGRIVSRRGHHLPLLICTVGIGLYPALTALATGQVWLPLIATVQGFFATGIDLAFFDTLLTICPPGKRPSYIALNTMLSSLAMFAAPMVGTFLASWMDIRLVFFIAGGIHLIAAVLFWRYRIAAEPHAG
jgi:MFS family permease